MNYLDFESKLQLLESKIEELKQAEYLDLNISKEINQLQKKHDDLLHNIYSKLTSWQKVQVARHQDRPHASDYINNIVSDYTKLCGDRLFGEDKAIIGGIGRIKSKSVMVLGIEKGADLENRIKHNFGMPMPEGYRKAQRLMNLADRLQLPIVTFVDTSGAYPGQEAEERGQGESIAKSIAMCLSITTPLISIIIGEGGSGGAIALAAGDKVAMLEHSIYSIISPEACASILLRNSAQAEEVAKSLKLTANDLKRFEIIDDIIPEGLGGAHRNKDLVYKEVEKYIYKSLEELYMLPASERKSIKQNRYLKYGKTSW